MLQITSEPLAHRQVQLTIVVPPERVRRELDAMAQAVARQQRIPGYRPGKAPFDRVAELVGGDKLREDAIERLAKQVSLEAVQAEAIEPVAPIHVGVMAEDPLTIRAVVPLSPAVELGDYRALRLPMPEVEPVQDGDIDAAIDALRRDLAEIEAVDRPAQAGDLVGLSLVGRFPAGEGAAGEGVFENGELHLRLAPEDAAAAGVPPAVIEHIVGLGAGDRASFDITYSELWPEPRLQGRVVAFEAEVSSVHSMVEPSLEALAERLGAPSLEELRERIGAQLGLRAVIDARTRLVEQAIAALVDQAEVDYPPALLELGMAEIIQDLRQSVERAGMTWEGWLRLQEAGQEALLADLESTALARLRQSWVMVTFAEAEQISVGKLSFEAEVKRVLASLAGAQGAPAGRKKPDVDAVRAEVMSQMMFDLAVGRLLEIVTDGADAATIEAATAAIGAAEATKATEATAAVTNVDIARAEPARAQLEIPREG